MELKLNCTQLEMILNDLNFYKIRDYGKTFRFGFDQYSNPTSININKETLIFYNFSTNDTGDLIELIKLKLGCSFKVALDFIQIKIGRKISQDKFNIFAETIKKIKYKMEDNQELIVYNDSVLDIYDNIVSDLFIKDGIGILAQKHFNIKYDDNSHRIVIPARNKDGQLVGAIGRINKSDYGNMSKYLPIIPYSKKKILFGMYENKDYLQDTLYVVESEKTVIRAYSMGYRNVVALGGSYISDEQLSLIKQIRPKRVVLLLDKGLLQLKIIQVRDKLISKNPFIKYTVGWLDSNNIDNLPNFCNPFDLDEHKCKDILNEIKWLNN